MAGFILSQNTSKEMRSNHQSGSVRYIYISCMSELSNYVDTLRVAEYKQTFNSPSSFGLNATDKVNTLYFMFHTQRMNTVSQAQNVVKAAAWSTYDFI